MLATAANAAAMAATVGGLAPQGELVIIGVTPDNLPSARSSSSPTACRSRVIRRVPSRDVEETMHFALQTGVRAVIEERPLAEAAEAYQAMDTGKARYRMVLTT